METRKNTNKPRKGAELPQDYLEMVEEVLNANFSTGLEALAKRGAESRFEVRGLVLPDEVVVGVTLTTAGQITATTFLASIDFDAQASAPTAQDCLAGCVDALGVLINQVLVADNDEKLTVLLAGRIADHENIPFEWTAVEVERFRVFLKMDASNPRLDQMADEWLAKNDPGMLERERQEHEETEELFVTGKKKNDPETMH